MGIFSGITTSDGVLLAIAVTTAWNTRQTSKIKSTGEATHILSNSSMGEQKKTNVELATQIAKLSHYIATLTNTEDARMAASAADVLVKEKEAIYKDHLVKQAIVDAK
jgi:hypothetical protein